MKNGKDVLYCGDASLSAGAQYLTGIMTHNNISYDYIRMHEPMPEGQIEGDYKLYVLSDYPSENFSAKEAEKLIQKIRDGSSLLMIGGWESFHGLLGNYHVSPLGQVLPVNCLQEDDRNNCTQGLIPELVLSHPITDGLPWDEPPVVCGFNRVEPKKGSSTLLHLRRLKISKSAVTLDEEKIPFLVVGEFGSGKTGALTTDIAPHWAGGFVDWGVKRVQAHAPGSIAIEVGDYYAAFIHNLLRFFLKI